MIVGNDPCHDAKGFAQRVVQVAVTHRYGFTLDLRHEPREVLDTRSRDRRVTDHLRHRITGVQRIKGSQLFGMCAQHRAGLAEHSGTLQRLESAPCVECGFSECDGRVDIRDTGIRYGRYPLCRRRVDGVDILPGLWGVPTSVEIEVPVCRQFDGSASARYAAFDGCSHAISRWSRVCNAHSPDERVMPADIEGL